MPKLNLYLITRADHATWDENAAHVVAAQTDDQARGMAASLARDEGRSAWFDQKHSVLTKIGTAVAGTEVGVILTDGASG